MAKRKFKYPNLRNKAGSQFIWYEFEISGHAKPYRGSTQTTNELAAHRFVQNLQVEMRKGPKAAEVVTMEMLRDFDLERAEADKIVTIDAIRHHWKNLMEFFRDTAKIDHSAVLAYARHREAKPLPNGRKVSNQTITREIAALKRGWNIAKQKKQAAHLDWADIWPSFKRDPKLKSQTARQWRTDEEMAFIVNFLNGLKGEAQAELVLCVLTGIRREELRRVVLQTMVQTVNKVAVLKVPEGKKRSAKRDTDREVALTPWMRSLFTRAIPTSGIAHVKHRMGTARRLGFDDWKHPPHCRDMRGLFSKVGMRSGVDSRIIDMALGHGHGTPGIYAEQPEQALLKIAEAIEAYWRPLLTLNF